VKLTIAPRRAPGPTELIEVVTPRTNAAVITPAENLFAAISLAEPFGLEIAATPGARWFLGRAASPAMRRHLAHQLGVAYPQAEIRHLDVESHPGLDPARRGPDEQVAGCALVLGGPPYLPLRTFRDAEVAADRAAQADPVLGILGALLDLPEGWRGLSQLVLRPAPDDWCRPYLRLAVEHPLAAERAAGRADTSLTGVFWMAGLLVAGTLAYQGYQWYDAGDWLRLGLLCGGAAAGAPGLVWLARRLGRRDLYDAQLVREKLSRVAYVAQLRLAVFAPAEAPAADVRDRLARLTAAYRQYNLAAGNGLRPRALRLEGRDLRALRPLPTGRTVAVLNTRELAGLWHLPQAQADLPLLERTTARRRLPLPTSVTGGCRIGASAHQGRSVPVALPDELLRRHLLLVAKTRRGKSSLLLRIARYLMEEGGPGGRPPAVVLVDPHRDLAEAALGLVPPRRWGDVVYLDVSRSARPFGLNLLDTGLGWDRDKAVGNALAIFRRQFDRFWGPRMEDAFRFALLTLYEANRAICAADPDGRGRQHTVLQVPTVLVDTAFRRSLLPLVTDAVVKAWWSGYFDLLDRRLQVEIVNPVQTKVQRFAGSRAARAVVGQPRSTIDPADWLRSGAIVLINTAKGTVGEDTAALIGGTLLNLVALAIGDQAGLAQTDRRRATLLVDEFHTMPGADYEGILSELAKYGANLVLATQSLARLEALDREQGRALRATVFANLDGLFAFHTSAEDAAYLVRELGGGIDEADLLELGEYQCYAKLSAGGERLPVFSLRLDPPPAGDPAVGEALAAASAQRYGRDAGAVERDLQSALARVELAHAAVGDRTRAGQAGAGIARDAVTGTGGAPGGAPGRRRPRTDNRKPKPPRAEAHQATLLDPADADLTGEAPAMVEEGAMAAEGEGEPAS
jgi:hypothetical protein